jgi:hypothetical protein
LGSAAADVTFSSISGAYTDLILIGVAGSSSDANYRIQFNSDTGSNYSVTQLAGNGSTAASFRTTSETSFLANRYAYLSNNLNNNILININNYSNTTTNKTALIRTNSAALGTDAIVGLYRSTSAITSVKIYPNAGNFITGSTFTLYGVKSA